MLSQRPFKDSKGVSTCLLHQGSSERSSKSPTLSFTQLDSIIALKTKSERWNGDSNTKS